LAQITESARDGVPYSLNAADDARDDRGEVEVVAMVAMVPVVVVRDVEMVVVVAAQIGASSAPRAKAKGEQPRPKRFRGFG